MEIHNGQEFITQISARTRGKPRVAAFRNIVPGTIAPDCLVMPREYESPSRKEMADANPGKDRKHKRCYARHRERWFARAANIVERDRK